MMYLPSGDQSIGTDNESDSTNNCSSPVPFVGFWYVPHLLLRNAPKAMKRPSGDQIGLELSRAASNVRGDILSPSINQMSPPLPSWRCTARRLLSGASEGLR